MHIYFAGSEFDIFFLVFFFFERRKTRRDRERRLVEFLRRLVDVSFFVRAFVSSVSVGTDLRGFEMFQSIQSRLATMR